jgi:hypothetical protein
LSDRAGYIREARERFDAYDENVWIKVYFDEHTGGYFVYHKEHKFDPKIGIFDIPRGDYEKIASGVLSKYGMRIVLDAEPSESIEKKADGFLNDRIFDIKSRENTFANSDKVKHKTSEASKQKAEIVVFYFHDKSMYNREMIIDGYGKYLRNSVSKRVQQIYCIVDGRLYRI